MENNQGYLIRQSVLFDNGRGFAMGENFKAPNPFVTWQFTEGGKRPSGLLLGPLWKQPGMGAAGL